MSGFLFVYKLILTSTPFKTFFFVGGRSFISIATTLLWYAGYEIAPAWSTYFSFCPFGIHVAALEYTQQPEGFFFKEHNLIMTHFCLMPVSGFL